MLNPVGQLPPSQSPNFSFNKIDALKTLRMALVLGAGALVTYVIPAMANYKYVVHINGQAIDFTPVVMPLSTIASEILRRLIANNQVPPDQIK